MLLRTMTYLTPLLLTLLLLPDTTLAMSSMANKDVANKASLSSGAISSNKLLQEPDMHAYAKGFSSVTSETSNRLCQATFGALPVDLVGTYYRSGPAMFTAGSIPPIGFSAVNPKEKPVSDGVDPSRMVKHPFDGDGAVLAVTFHPESNSCTARYRFVKTSAFENERKKGKKIYDGMDSTRLDNNIASMHPGNDFPLPLFRYHLQPGLNKKRRNTSNTRSVFWGKKLLSMWEGGLPYKIDSLALSTAGKSQLGGVLPPDAAFSGKATYDCNKDRMLFYSTNQDASASEIRVYEFDNTFKLVGTKEEQQIFKLPGYAIMNDFAVTKSYSIFVQPVVEVNTFPFMMSKDPSKSIDLKTDGKAILHIFPRVGVNSKMLSIPIPKDAEPESDFDLHFCNAYENDSDEIVFDVIRSNLTQKKKSLTNWPWVSSLVDFSQSVSGKSLWRYHCNISTGKIKKTLLSDLNCNLAVINPAHSGREHRFIYANVGSLGNNAAPPQGIAKFDCKSNSFEVSYLL